MAHGQGDNFTSKEGAIKQMGQEFQNTMVSPTTRTFWSKYVHGHVELYDYHIHIWNCALEYRRHMIVPENEMFADIAQREATAAAYRDPYLDQQLRLVAVLRDGRAAIELEMAKPTKKRFSALRA